MLVLTRKTDQSIVINSPRTGEIEVFIVEIRGDQVRLGIQAPSSVPVHRKEVYLQIQKENEAASKTSVDVLPVVPAEGLPALPSVPAGSPGKTVGMTLEEIRRRGKKL